ncbi:MAG: thioesterase family protein [Bacteroidota bacterium]
MPRIKIDLPEKFTFSVRIPVRITDINYGGHVGNDTILSILHEARVQFLKSYGYSELNCGGAGLIMSDVGIEFKNELFYEDIIIASVEAVGFSKVAFEIYYKLEKQTDENKVLIAIAKTGMVCYDYTSKKIIAVPQEVKEKLSA